MSPHLWSASITYIQRRMNHTGLYSPDGDLYESQDDMEFDEKKNVPIVN